MAGQVPVDRWAVPLHPRPEHHCRGQAAEATSRLPFPRRIFRQPNALLENRVVRKFGVIRFSNPRSISIYRDPNQQVVTDAVKVW